MAREIKNFSLNSHITADDIVLNSPIVLKGDYTLGQVKSTLQQTITIPSGTSITELLKILFEHNSITYKNAYIQTEPVADVNDPQVINSSLDIRKNLKIGTANTIGSNVKNCLVAGTSLDANADNTIVLGVNAVANNKNMFVWNGNPDVKFEPTSGEGTFNINTVNGADDVYIGNKKLTDMILELANSLD